MTSSEAAQTVAEALHSADGIRVPTTLPPSDDERKTLLGAAMASGEKVEIATRIDPHTYQVYFLVRRFK